MAKAIAKKRSAKSKRTEVTWASEDVTRRAIEAIESRLDVIEDTIVKITNWVKAEESKRSSDAPETPATGS